MMSTDERQTALKNIASVVPSAVFDRLINVLTMIEERNNDALVQALSEVSTNPTHSFAYRMNTKDHVESITPIREILDLCEGWFITSHSVANPDERVRWEVNSIIEEGIK
jgi:hypothetical protein